MNLLAKHKLHPVRKTIMGVVVRSSLLALSACGANQAAGLAHAQTPAVRAGNGGSAELVLSACMTPSNAVVVEQAFARLLTTLNTAGILVESDSGSAKLVINLCPGE